MTRWLLIALALVACSPSSLPSPRIVALSPSRMQASDAIRVQIQLEAVLPFFVDFGGTRASVDSRVSVDLGGQALAASEIDSGGCTSVFVPSVFAPGVYDLSIQLADGRTAVAPGAFTVDPGQWPDSYEFLPQPTSIGDQVEGQPFPITVRARMLDGGTDTSFEGTVSLSLNRPSGSPPAVEPVTTGPFDAGVLTEPLVTISGSGTTIPNITMIVTDLGGHSGTSNVFRVSQP